MYSLDSLQCFSNELKSKNRGKYPSAAAITIAFDPKRFSVEIFVRFSMDETQSLSDFSTPCTWNSFLMHLCWLMHGLDNFFSLSKIWYCEFFHLACQEICVVIARSVCTCCKVMNWKNSVCIPKTASHDLFV